MIFSVFHKPFPVPQSPDLRPLYVGKAEEKIPDNALRDNTGDNISALNNNYCELTALYWLWKNYKQDDDEIIGFCHYRRYFIPEGFKPFISHFFRNNYIKKRTDVDFDALASDKFITSVKALLIRYEFILPYYHHLNRFSLAGLTIAAHYKKYHSQKDWQLLKEITCNLYPEYKPSFEKVEKRRKMFIYNMFITRRKNFNRYCEWLFPVMFAMYDKLSISSNDYQKNSNGLSVRTASERIYLSQFWIQPGKKTSGSVDN